MDKKGPGLFAFTIGLGLKYGSLLPRDDFAEKAGADFIFKVRTGSNALPRRSETASVEYKLVIVRPHGKPSTWPGRNIRFTAEVESDDEGAPIASFLIKSPAK